jgi:hypothetical protein
MMETVTKDPWRQVETSTMRTHGPDDERHTRWWELRLVCGHTVERLVKYKVVPGLSRGGKSRRSETDIMPAPRRARCEFCVVGL